MKLLRVTLLLFFAAGRARGRARLRRAREPVGRVRPRPVLLLPVREQPVRLRQAAAGHEHQLGLEHRLPAERERGQGLQPRARLAARRRAGDADHRRRPKTEGETGWQSHVDHDSSELAQPGYHRLHLDRYGITAELTATDRVGLHRYTYDKAGPSEVIVNLGGTLGEAEMLGSHVERVGNALEGYVDQRGVLTDGQYYGTSNGQRNRLFFRIEFDQPFDALERTGEVYSVRFGAREAPADEGRAVADRRPTARRRNMQAELPGWNFEQVKRASQKRWNEMLGRIDVRGGTHQQQVKFYTDLFHVLCGRSTISDADGRYLDNTWQAPARAAREAADVQLRRAVADAVEPEHGPRARLPGCLRAARQLACCRCTRTAGCCRAGRWRATTRS